ncbi:asparagine synthetase B family protein [Pelagibius marinus]|uniref:asparagine synthetase B family protein n=1 Tax=Pelagibius marinus TaxID=2762760 RepID=UPI001872C4C5|nr:asparagine synthase-related protein [Pelagibius marinus]
MSAFCGWLALSDSDRPPQAMLDTMSAAFRGRRLKEGRVASGPAAAWVTTAAPQADLCTAEDPWVVIVGTVDWRDAALIKEQQKKGAAWALRRAYLEHGLKLFDSITGAFAFAILDRQRRRVLLAIDRMGIHRLYYAAVATEGLVFGTTADMVRAHPKVESSVSLQAVYGYLHAFVCRSPRTIYEAQRKLEPAQYLLWQDGRSRVASYWQMPFVPDRRKSPTQFGDELVAQVRRAVHGAVSCDEVAVTGAFLSGGLDSSTVTGMLSEVTPGPVETFTIGFEEAPYDEMYYAGATARRFGARDHRYYLTAEATAMMAPKIAAYYDEPFGNSSALPAYFCAVQAREAGMTRLLAGDGGDEILAGNSRYLEQLKQGRYQRLPKPLRIALKSVIFHLPLLCSTRLCRRAQQHILRAEMPLPERLEAYNFYQPGRMAEVFDPQILPALDLDAPWRELRQAYLGAAAEDPLLRMMHLDLKYALADADLKKVTGMCDLAGIDVAFPFLDDDLVAFCATIPPELLLKDGRLRAFYKDTFRHLLPQEVIAKKKHGFGMPFYEWTRDDPRLRELAYDSLGSLRGRHIISGGFIDEVRRQHARPARTPYDGLVWDLMMLELWFASHGF